MEHNYGFPNFDNVNNMLKLATDGITNMLLAYTNPINEIVKAVTSKFDEMARVLSESTKPLRAIHRMADNQYVYWSYLNSEFIDLIIDSNNVNRTLREINLTKDGKKEISIIIERCKENALIAPYTKLYTQAIDAFESGKNEIALLALLSIIDGLLTDVSKNDTTSIFSRADSILKKIEEDDDIESEEYGILALTFTFRLTMESLSSRSDFSKKEPKNLNRHWIMHGRSRRRKTKLDCIKIIRFIYGIILIDELSRKEAIDNGI